jgi:F-type H+-transporting ATPase subunit delta
MSGNAEARLSALDRVLDAARPSAALSDELFAAVDALSGSPSLRRALTDQGTPEAARLNVVRSLFGGRLSADAVGVVEAAVKLPWATTGALLAAIERQGVRAILVEAESAGRLDEVEDQLFKVGRAVAADPDLRRSLGERRVPLAGRRELLDDLIGGRVLPSTQALARRALVARQNTFESTLDTYLKTAAELRDRGIATVEVARPLTADQESRLRAALGRQAGRDVTLHVIVNPAVLGGVRVSLGDEVIEGTVAGRLSDVRRKLS